ncbi:MAG: hypothetical protein GMKNLPBB_01930 [Myxococcota bacterium]|nr:hypothetical protein [Myxococcota bacterium]
MKVLYLSKTDPQGASSRYRIYQFLPLLRENGVDVEVRPLFDARYFDIIGGSDPKKPGLRRDLKRAAYSLERLAARIRQMRGASGFDLVVLEHQAFPYLPPVLEHWLLHAPGAPPVVVEFDDAIYLTRFHHRKIAWLLGQAAGVIAGNHHLAAWAGQHNPRVVIAPTVVDLTKYQPRQDYGARRPFRIGWVGLPYNFDQLETIAPALEQINRRHPIELAVLSRGRPAISGVPVVELAWSEDGEAAGIARFDAGVMPLADTPWTRGKCGAKLLQYMAAGVPAAGSPVGVNRDIIQHDINGLLASTQQEWVEALTRLIESESLRRTLGEAGRRRVEDAFSLQAWAPRLAEVYRRFAR